MTPEQQAIIFGLRFEDGSANAARTRREQVLAAFDTNDGRALSRNQLELAAAAREPDDVEASLVLVHIFGSDRSILPVLRRLARDPWHNRHEDVSSLLEEVGGDALVADFEFLAWAGPEYQDYEGSTSLAKKAIHSLERIGSPDARAALTRLRDHPEADVRELIRRVQARMPPAAGQEE